MGSLAGVVLAAIIMTVLPELQAFNEYRMLMFGLLMVVYDVVASTGSGANDSSSCGVAEMSKLLGSFQPFCVRRSAGGEWR